MRTHQTSIRFRFRGELPMDVRLGDARWRIREVHYPKGKVAIAATCGVKGGDFVGGRPSDVDRARSRGIVVPLGTVRYKLVMQLVASDRAEIIGGIAAPDWDELP